MATIKEIAEAAGVSVGTVDRILHKRGRYSQKTAEKIDKLVKEMGYSPNMHARGLKKSIKHSFSVVMPLTDQDGGFWGLILEGVYKSQKELAPFGTEINIYQFNRYSEESCKAAFENAFNDDSIGLLVIPTRSKQIKGLLEAQDKPYLFIDTDIPDMESKIAYIGQDSNKSGVLAAKLMSLLLNGKSNPKILIIEPYYTSDYHLENRRDGFLSRIKEIRDDVTIETIKNEEINRTDTSILEPLNSLETLPDGIFVTNAIVFKIANYLNNKGEQYRGIPLIGYDILPAELDLIANGTIDFIITQQPTEQSYLGIKALYDTLILKKRPKKKTIIPMNIITKENLSTF